MILSVRKKPGFALASIVLLSVFAFGFSGSSRADGDEDSPLYLAMEELQSSLRKLRKAVGNPDEKKAAIEMLRGMQRHAITAFQNPPKPAKDLAADKHAQWEVGFRRKIVGLVDQLLVVELAVAEGRTEDAQAGYKELTKHKKEGHDAYIVD